MLAPDALNSLTVLLRGGGIGPKAMVGDSGRVRASLRADCGPGRVGDLWRECVAEASFFDASLGFVLSGRGPSFSGVGGDSGCVSEPDSYSGIVAKRISGSGFRATGFLVLSWLSSIPLMRSRRRESALNRDSLWRESGNIGAAPYDALLISVGDESCDTNGGRIGLLETLCAMATDGSSLFGFHGCSEEVRVWKGRCDALRTCCRVGSSSIIFDGRLALCLCAALGDGCPLSASGNLPLPSPPEKMAALERDVRRMGTVGESSTASDSADIGFTSQDMLVLRPLLDRMETCRLGPLCSVGLIMGAVRSRDGDRSRTGSVALVFNTAGL